MMKSGSSLFARVKCMLPGWAPVFGALMVWACPSPIRASSPPPPPAEKPAAPRVLRMVYFVPSDREPYPDYRDRVTRIMRDIQDFYRVGMEKNGWGPRTFKLEEGADNQLSVHVVKGTRPADYYTFDHGHDMREEIGRSLAARGIDINRETIVIFAALLNFDPLPDGRIRITGDCPYYGSGTALWGTGWFNDDPGLDTNRLRDATPIMIYKGADIPRGRLNSVLIGGIAHELGHALGLPHDMETHADRMAGRGTALMGAGNYTYREELRKEGAGSFLTAAESAMLACHPLFNPQPAAVPSDFRGELDRFILRYEPKDQAFLAEGHWQSAVPAHSAVIFNDEWGSGPKNQNDDYDAVSWTAKVETNGSFRIRVGELRPGTFEMRLIMCHANGVNAPIPFRYQIGADGVPDVRDIQNYAALMELTRLFTSEDLTALHALLERNDPAELPGEARDALKEWLAARNGIRTFPALADAPAETRRVMLSEMAWDEAQVGWIRPMRNGVPDLEMPLLYSGNRFHRHGLYAHAPARHVYLTRGQWKTFTAEAGIQCGKTGRVVFVVRGDDRELYRSSPVSGITVIPVRVDVSGVQRLELVVEDAGDTNHADWAVWLNPALER